ncbi:MAG: glycosyltransferase [Chloroflexota bacterium]|nr:MAG: glycosyltransferase [Chloroflexota bacterium]
MLDLVPIQAKSLGDYGSVIGDDRVARIRAAAEPLRDARVLHLNATAFGGGVAEILATLVPLMRDVGVQAEWRVIHGDDSFFKVTKSFHNALQGMPIAWTAEMWQTWMQFSELNANLFDGEYDFVVAHDPQTAGMLSYLSERGVVDPGRWTWRCHIDLTEAQPEVWDFLRPFVQLHGAIVFTMPQFVREDLNLERVAIIPPSIDPLSSKNVDLDSAGVTQILERYGVDPKRPIITQVSRFDPWKDPLGVIDVYREVKSEFPDVQLVMVASMAHDDPEGWSYYERTARHAGEDEDIHLLSNLQGVGNWEVNAFQRASDVVIQKSLREGFGLVVAEALWKGRPVVAGAVGGIPLQVLDGQTGFLVNSVEDCADRVIELLRSPSAADQMGESGREHVRRWFLLPRNLEDYLSLFKKLAHGTAACSVPPMSIDVDNVHSEPLPRSRYLLDSMSRAG